MSAKKTLTVCNIYLPPSLDVNFSDLDHLIQQLPAPFVLVGDLNAHSPLWGNVRQDSRGQMIEELLNDYNLYLLNTGEPTYRHHSHHSFSVPDVSLCDPSLALEFDWLTNNDLCGSYHFPVILKTSLLMMMNLHTGNSTGLTGCPSALCVCRGCLTSWSCLRIQWFSLQTL